jgi:hypothetical protein
MCIKLNMESYMGFENTVIPDPKEYMGLESNCRGSKVTVIKKFQWLNMKDDPRVKLEMSKIESPY